MRPVSARVHRPLLTGGCYGKRASTTGICTAWPEYRARIKQHHAGRGLLHASASLQHERNGRLKQLADMP